LEMEARGGIHFISLGGPAGDDLYQYNYGFQVLNCNFYAGENTTFMRGMVIIDYGNLENTDDRRFDLTYVYDENGITKKKRSLIQGCTSHDNLIKWAIGITRSLNVDIIDNTLHSGNSVYQPYHQIIHTEDGTRHVLVKDNIMHCHKIVPDPCLGAVEENFNLMVMLDHGTDVLYPADVEFINNEIDGEINKSAFFISNLEEFYFSQNQFTNFTKPADKLILNVKSYNPTSILWDGLGNIINGVPMNASDVQTTDIGPRPADGTAPAAPSNLTAATHDGVVYLSWDLTSDKNMAEYRIYRSTNTGGPYTLIADDYSISYYEDLAVASGTTYYYVVTVADMAGNESGDSIEVSATPASGSETLAFNPVADTYSKQNAATVNYGMAVALQVRADDTSKEKNSYLKFNVAGVSGSIQSATLKVHSAANPFTGLAVHTVADTTWDEMALAWNNAPAIGGSLSAIIGDIVPNTWYELDVTSAIATGDGLYSFALKTPSDLAYLELDSKESANAPILEVVYTTTGEINTPPEFTSDPVVEVNAMEDVAYSGNTLADDASDPDPDTLTFSAISGPVWLNVASDGALTGMPGSSDVGANSWQVQVSDGTDQDVATLEITVDGGGDNNDTPGTAVTLSDNVARNDSINPAGDDDWFKFTLPSGPHYDLVLETAGSSGDTVMYLYGPNSSTSLVESDDDDGDGLFSKIVRNTSGTALSAGIYYVKVIEYGDNGTIAAYTINADWSPRIANGPPVFDADPFSKANATANAAYSGSIEGDASDPESDPMTLSKVSGPVWLNVASDGTLSGTPGTGDVGANSWTVRVEANGGFDEATLEITVNAAPPAWVDVDFEDFESGWGIWNDGGIDARRDSSDSAYAPQGTYCARIRDNTSTSVITTDSLTLSGSSEIRATFSYRPRSMDNSAEDFWLQISTDGGSNYTTVEEWSDDEFVNGQVYTGETVTITGYSLTDQTRLRFRCDASGDKDWVYIDEVRIESK